MFYNKKIIEVEGMHCEHCASKVEESLKKIQGIKSARVSLKDNKVTLKYKGDLDLGSISKIISDLGYSVVGE